MDESNTLTNKLLSMTADFDIQINNLQTTHVIDDERLCSAANKILSGENISKAMISLAVVDDSEIHRLNVKYLKHDFVTDVLSFLLSDNRDQLEGEVIVSADTAARQASAYNWSLDDELLLYVVHGILHLVGYDDKTDDVRSKMRDRERHYLTDWGLEPRYDRENDLQNESSSGPSTTTLKKGESCQ